MKVSNLLESQRNLVGVVSSPATPFFALLHLRVANRRRDPAWIVQETPFAERDILKAIDIAVPGSKGHTRSPKFFGRTGPLGGQATLDSPRVRYIPLFLVVRILDVETFLRRSMVVQLVWT